MILLLAQTRGTETMYTEAQTEGSWLILMKWDATGAVEEELELKLSDYDNVVDALSSNGYELAGDWHPEGHGYRADIWAL